MRMQETGQEPTEWTGIQLKPSLNVVATAETEIYSLGNIQEDSRLNGG